MFINFLGAVIGTVFCSVFIDENPVAPQFYSQSYEYDEVNITHRNKRPYYPPRPVNSLKLTRKIDKQNGISCIIQLKNCFLCLINKKKYSLTADKLSEIPKCSICLEPFEPSILLLPCTHKCFCDACYDKVRRKHISKCPICRIPINEVLFVCP